MSRHDAGLVALSQSEWVCGRVGSTAHPAKSVGLAVARRGTTYFGTAYRAEVGRNPHISLLIILNYLILLALPRGLEPLFSP